MTPQEGPTTAIGLLAGHEQAAGELCRVCARRLREMGEFWMALTAEEARHQDLLRRLSTLMTADTSVQAEGVKQTCQQIEQTESELIDKEIAYYNQVRTTLEPGQRREFWELFQKARLGPAPPAGGPATDTGRPRRR
jgi:hypothetical protein